MTNSIPAPISKCLQKLQRRMLAVRLLRGLGLLLLASCLIIALSFCLDYFLQPPVVVRVLHASFAVLGALYLLNLWLIRPLRYHPTASQLAAIIEQHFDLDDRLSSSVELSAQQTVQAGSFLESLIEETVADCVDLEPQKIFKVSAPLYQFTCAILGCATLALCANYFPDHNGIFWQRMLGKDIAWPAKTKLVFVVENVDTNKNLVSFSSPNHLVLHTTDPGNLSVQVRAIGNLPQRVLLHGLQRAKNMVPLGGGDYIYNLPPLKDSVSFTLTGADHQINSSSLTIIIGDAPRLNDWAVTVSPPPYTMLGVEQSSLNEIQVVAGSTIEFSFTTSDQASSVKASLSNKQTLELTGMYNGEVLADNSDDLTIKLESQDGFVSYYPQQLSWQVYSDLAPQIEVVYPQRNFHAVIGGLLPLALRLSDDFALSHLTLSNTGGDELHSASIDGVFKNRFFALDVPSKDAQLTVTVLDNQQPNPNEANLFSANYYVQTADDAEKYLSAEIQILRRRLDSLHDKLDLFAKIDEPASNFEVQRLVDSLDTALDQSEWLLAERIFGKIDGNPAVLVEGLQTLLSTNTESGDIVNFFASQNANSLQGRSNNLWQLSNAILIARQYPATDLLQELDAQGDLRPHFVVLRDEIDVILETVVSWEDYQSAVNLLRQLLDRQRGLYLRTQEAVL